MNRLESIVRRIAEKYIKNFSKEDKILFGSILSGYKDNREQYY